MSNPKLSFRQRVIRACERYLGVHLYVIRCRPLDLGIPDWVKIPEGVQIRRLTEDELRVCTKDPELHISPDFLSGALARGDRAYAAIENGKVLSYTWRSEAGGPHEPGVSVCVSPPYIYAYKGFTRPEHRGRQLIRAIISVANSDYIERGGKQMVAFVALYNASSLAIERDYGMVRVGYAGYLRWFGSVVPFRTKGVRKTGFRFRRAEFS